MPSSASRSPKVATCEELDESTQKVKPNTCTTANVPGRQSQSSELNSKPAVVGNSQDGSDSGYSSQTRTNESVASGRQKPAVPSINTNIMDRQPQPYARTAAPKSSRPPSEKSKEGTKEKSPRKQPQERFRHPRGQCMTCDALGYHTEQSIASPNIATSPNILKHTTKAKDDAVRPRSRPKSFRTERPVSMIDMMSPVYMQPVMPSYVQPQYTYQTPTPVNPPQLFSYHHNYPSHEYALSSSYQEHSNYFDLHMAPPITSHYPQPQSGPYITYGEHPAQQPQYTLMNHPTPPTTHHVVRRKAVAQGPTHYIDRDAELMPPPPRPKSAMRRASNDHHVLGTARKPVRYATEEGIATISKHQSRESSTHDCCPPSAWKTSERPRNRKSVSYSDEHISTEVSSTYPRGNLPRRRTDLDERVADAELYQNTTSRGSSALTAEALKGLNKTPGLPSEVGTRRSFQSSAKESTRSKRPGTAHSASGTTNITFNEGIQLSIPRERAGQEITMQVNDLTLSINKDRETTRTKEQKRIGRASSNASRGSRKSPVMVDGNDDQPLSREESRRSLQPDQLKASTNSIRKPSREPSLSRTGSNATVPQSPSRYDYRPEDFYGS